MESLWNKIIREAKAVSLTKEEHDFILSNIRKKVYLNKTPKFNTKKTVKSPYLYHFRFGLSLHEKRFVPVAVFLILIIFGGTSFAANFALPGQALYGMKVNVNEEVESWIALTPNANARFESVKADRRLKEVEKLTVQKKKISPKAKAQIKESFAQNAKKVKQIVAEIEASGEINEAALVKAEFENKLEAHSVVLSKLASDEDAIVEIDAEGKNDIKEIGIMVDEHINDLKLDQEAKEAANAKTESKDESKKDGDKNVSEIENKESSKLEKTEKEPADPESAALLSIDAELKTEVEDSLKIETKTQANAGIDSEDENKKKEDKIKIEVNNILSELELEHEIED